MAVINPSDPAVLPLPPARAPLIPYLPIRTALRVVLPALLLGWVGDALFYRHPLGVNFPLFTALTLATLFWVARREGVSPSRRNLWPIVPTLFFALMVAVRQNELLTILNVLAVGALLSLLAWFFAHGRLEALGLLGYPAAITASLAGSCARPVPAFAATGRLVVGQRIKVRRSVPVLRGALLALPLLLVFTALLYSADSIFAGYVDDVFEIDLFTHLPERLWRLTLIFTAAWVIAGGILVALRRHARPDAVTDGAPLITRLRLGIGETATILLLVDALFAAFVWVQFAYLFSGEAARTMHFEQYRLYARRGFGELLAVSVMTLLLIASLRAVAWRPEWTSRFSVHSRRDARLFNALATTMIALTLVMLLSAFQRMLQWESVEFYINTATRLYVRWFIVWLAVAFAWMAGTLWLRPDRFAIGGFVAGLGFLVSMNLQDPDADVARFNLARQDELSARYVTLLSDDAVAALAAALASPEQSSALPPDVRARIAAHLDYRLSAYERAPSGWEHWPSAHLGRARARGALLTLRQKGLI
ncbi:MAG TPA: DUF4173 domain-containing protein [Chloroflexota bacterium]|nr:DUF4173 domain-containing protein [Chloroflexota bacterium]